MLRLAISPTATNGLRGQARVMVDKITTVSRQRLGKRIGRLDVTDLQRLDRAILVFLGLA